MRGVQIRAQLLVLLMSLPVITLFREAAAAAADHRDMGVYKRGRRSDSHVASHEVTSIEELSNPDEHLTQEDASTDKRYMRFGREPLADHDVTPQEKNRRYSLREHPSGSEAVRLEKDKRYMRFGRRHSQEELDEQKRYMRFGRALDSEDLLGPATQGDTFENDIDREMKTWKSSTNHDTKFSGAEAYRGIVLLGGSVPDKEHPLSKLPKGDDVTELKKRYMRFGRSSSMFQESSEHQASAAAAAGRDKRYMRFGRNDGTYLSADDVIGDVEKRYMRFGRSSFGTLPDGDNDDVIGLHKRYMRFGRAVDNGDGVEKRYMRFGREAGEEKKSNGKKCFRTTTTTTTKRA